MMDTRDNSVRHPNENLLAAFAEETLTAQERQLLLQHLSECSRCREIVFLAHEAAPASVATAPQHAPSSFVWKRPLLWGYALALVVLAGGTLSLLHTYQSPAPAPIAQPMAQVQPQPPAAALGSQPAPQAQQPKSVPAPVVPARATPSRIPAAVQAPQQQIEAKSTSPAVAQNNQIVSGLQTSPAAVPAKSLDLGSGLNSASGYALMPSPTGMPSQAPFRAQTAKLKKAEPRTAVVSADMQGLASPEASSVMPLTMGAMPVQASPALEKLARFELQNGHIQRCIGDDCTVLTLPDQKDVTSLATKRNVTFALDTEGKLFMSRTEGSTWETIPTQWRGRARNVSVIESGQKHQPWNRLMRQPDAPAQGMHGTTTTPSLLQLQALPVPVFSLTNEEGESWQTFDLGKNWKKVEKAPAREEH